jgi:hypothetical protein
MPASGSDHLEGGLERLAAGKTSDIERAADGRVVIRHTFAAEGDLAMRRGGPQSAFAAVVCRINLAAKPQKVRVTHPRDLGEEFSTRTGGSSAFAECRRSDAPGHAASPARSIV